MPDIFGNLVRLFGFVLDSVIYSLIPIVYKLFIYLSEINLFSMDDSSPIGALIGRIYVFLGIFMLFKVTFSLLQYLIDPNAFSDKSKGFGKLVTNAMVTILLLVSVPYIFNYAMILQNKIVTSNAIGSLIMGNSLGNVVTSTTTKTEIINGKAVEVETPSELDVSQVNEMATDLQFLMYGAFFSINPKAILNENVDESGNNSCANTPIFGTVAMAQTGEGGCLGDLKAEFENPNSDMARSNTLLTHFFKTAESQDPNAEIKSTGRDFGRFGNLLLWKDSNGQYVINYLPFVSAAAGLYVVFLLVSFSVDIAVRAIKLCFLEMIAPIAIVSYIDPKETISNSKLRNWIKECLTTYLSLFLRLATLFLVMMLISVIASSVLAQDGPISKQINNMEAGYNIWIYLFLIIGAFMFAKKVPPMIESIFGIKLSGELSLNQFKSPVVAGALGGAIGAGATALGAYSTARDMNQGVGRSLLSAAGGLGSGFARGSVMGAKSGGKNILSSASAAAGKTTRAMELRDTTKFGDRLGARFRNNIGAQSKYETLENRAKVFDSVSNYASAMEDRAKDQLMKKDANWQQIQTERIVAEQNLKNGVINQDEYNNALFNFHEREDKLVEDYINRGGLEGKEPDAQLAHTRDALDRVVKENRLNYKTSDWEQIDDSGKDAKAQADNLRYSDEYENAKAVHEMQKSGMMQSHIKR